MQNGNGRTGNAPRAPWRAAGLRWQGEEPVLEWWAPTTGSTRSGALPLGSVAAFGVGADRRCVGVWRSGRRIPCGTNKALDPSSRGARCGACARLDRQYSVAADTLLDDPRPYAVYLAHHGSAGIKVGITAAERGLARLLEQGALASVFLSEGTLPSARRVEHLLGVALGLPDRVATVRKREARRAPGNSEERAAALFAHAALTRELPWPEGQTRRPDTVVTDHCAHYGLPDAGLRPDAAVAALRPGDVVSGRVMCRTAGDLYLSVPSLGLVLLDTRLLAGWAVCRTEAGAPFSAEAVPVPRMTEPQEQPGLF
ncbi:DUF2797 domain-containing protein [Streptacidiphilus jiangxiensis]|uniref:DUF2797 domain-containing protein n=1 Tax=Streptacidiphilus jiangxiensis TaxID=235985 RepID=A0A1H7NE24_STRJI|nr:DUF2797 domain-containing protein [Streptacidiphilus jiangxiensis]SEL21836.1 Protein of unknown function [Streptacidiphilus jiangxiensis]